jgi:hypothetical protein
MSRDIAPPTNCPEFNLYPEAGTAAREDNKPPRESSVAYRLTGVFLSKAPAPLARMIGNYCYRHLG